MVNNLGVDPDEWFEDGPSEGEYLPENGDPPSWEDTAPSEYEPPMQDSDWFIDKIEKPDESDEIEEEKTMHQKMYEIATAKYNPFAVGGSESLGGGSEQLHSPEEFGPGGPLQNQAGDGRLS